MNPDQSSSSTCDSRIRRKLAINLFLLLASIYFLTSSGNTVDVTDDAMVRYAMTERLAWQKSLALPKEIGTRWGVAGRHGEYYTKYGLGHSLLAIPFYLVGQPLGKPKFLVSLLGPILSASSCVLLFSLALRSGFPVRTATTLALMTGLCTQLWPEAKSPFDHHIETFFSLLCVYQAVAFLEERHEWRLLLGGASLGFAVLTRVTTGLWLIPLAVILYASSRNIILRIGRLKAFLRVSGLFAAGMAPWLIVFFWYNFVRFGSIFETGYSLWAVEKGFNNFGTPLLLGLSGELVSPGKGLLVYCPIFLLTLAGTKGFLARQRDLGTAVIAASVIYLVFFAKYRVWHGDIAWGPRFLTFLMPYWILIAGAAWEKLQKTKAVRLQRVAFGIVGVSFLFQLAGVMVDMNLHYMRLLSTGVIEHVESYSYSPGLYFSFRHSPLVDRFGEIGQALNIMPVTGVGKAADPAEIATRPEIDFWWLQPAAGIARTGAWVLVCPFVFEVFSSGFRIRRLLKLTIGSGAEMEKS
jgi:hypothetical protein